MKQQEHIGRSDYEERREKRIQRLHARAEKAEEKSAEYWEASTEISRQIPFGQPILIDHYSAPRAIRDKEKIHNYMRKSFEEKDKSEYYRYKAKAAEENEAINSDDPKALEKLNAKLKALEESHEVMKEANKYFRKHGTLEGFTKLSEERIKQIERYRGRNGQPFPSYTLSNSRQNIRSVKKRIEELKEIASMEEKEVSGSDWIIKVSKEHNRVMIIFDDKPDADIRKKLKGNGFRWAPSVGAWQKKISAWNVYNAETIMKEYEEERN